MIKLTQVGAGSLEAPREVYDATGTGFTEIELQVTGTATYRVDGRVSPDAPWMQVMAPASASAMQKIDWVPWLRLVITAGSGTVDMWVAEAAGSPVAVAPSISAPTSGAPVALVPGKPVLTAQGVPGGIALTWPAPADNGSPITDYQLREKLNTDPDSAYVIFPDGTSSSTGATFPGTVGLPYDSQVRAVNAAGPGPWSDVATATPTATSSAPVIVFATGNVSQAEGDTGSSNVACTLNATRNGTTGDLVVPLTYTGTATSGSDYAPPPANVTILAGQNSATFNIAVNGDKTVETNETIIITATGGASMTITITNDDVTVSNLFSESLLVAAMGTSSEKGEGPGAGRNNTSGGYDLGYVNLANARLNGMGLNTIGEAMTTGGGDIGFSGIESDYIAYDTRLHDLVNVSFGAVTPNRVCQGGAMLGFAPNKAASMMRDVRQMSDAVTVWVTNVTAGMTFFISLDGGATETQFTTTKSQGVEAFVVTGTAAANRTIRMRTPATNTSFVYLIAMAPFLSTRPEIRHLNFSGAGWNSTDSFQTLSGYAFSPLGVFGNMGIDVLRFNMGTGNGQPDVSIPANADTYVMRILALLDQARSGNPKFYPFIILKPFNTNTYFAAIVQTITRLWGILPAYPLAGIPDQATQDAHVTNAPHFDAYWHSQQATDEANYELNVAYPALKAWRAAGGIDHHYYNLGAGAATLNTAVTEGGTTSITITRGGKVEVAGSVDYSVVLDTATIADIASVNGVAVAGTAAKLTQTIAFAAGETTKTVDVVTKDDLLVDGTRSWTARLQNPTAGALIGLNNVACTILDNDTAGTNYTENFVEAVNGTLLTAHTSDTGDHYTTTGTPTISSNRMYFPDNGVATADFVGTSNDFAYAGVFRCTQNINSVYACVGTDELNRVGCGWQGSSGGFILFDRVAGSTQVIGAPVIPAGGPTAGTNYSYQLQRVGGVISFFLDLNDGNGMVLRASATASPTNQTGRKIMYQGAGTGSTPTNGWRFSSLATAAAIIAPSLSFTSPTASVAEGNTGTTTVINTVNVVRNGALGDLVVNLTYGGTAVSGTDYAAPPTTATILAGNSSVTFNVLVNGNTIVDGNRTLSIHAALAAYPAATADKLLTITDDDVAGTYNEQFTEATPGTALSAHTSDSGATYPTGSGGPLHIYVNRLKASAAGWQTADFVGSKADFAYSGELRYIGSGSTIGAYFCVGNDAANCIQAGWVNGSGGFGLYDRVTDTPTAVAAPVAFAATVNTSYPFQLQRVNGVVSFFVDKLDGAGLQLVATKAYGASDVNRDGRKITYRFTGAAATTTGWGIDNVKTATPL